jgi:hypothetical protein
VLTFILLVDETETKCQTHDETSGLPSEFTIVESFPEASQT